MLRISVVFFTTLSAFVLSAAAIAKPIPESWSVEDRLPSDQIERVEYRAPDLEALAIEDEFNEALGQPPRFAVPNEISVSPLLAGTWTEAGDFSVWRYRVTAEDAVSLNFGFNNVSLPQGARLYIYSVAAGERGEMDRFEVLGPYGSEINEAHGEFWTPLIASNDVIIELDVPFRSRDQVSLELVRINQGYRGFGQAALKYRQQDLTFGDGKQSGDCGKGEGGTRSGTCNMDVACLADDDPWNDPRRSVGAYSRSGTLACTGSLLNNTAGDRAMLFVTATHCGVSSGSAPSVVVYWNYEWPTCRTPGDSSGSQVNPPDPAITNSGAQLLAATLSPFSGGGCTNSGDCSDMTLLELDDPADPEFDLYWAGWDRRSTPAACGPQGAPGSTDGLCASIHHPGVDEKRITFVEDDFIVGNIAAAQGVHWHSFWHPDPPVVGNIPEPQPSSIPAGVTEPGSSGSPLYTSEQRFVGVLSGGPASCGATGANLSDFYGQLAHAWEGLGTPTTRMRDYLDPLGTNPEVIAGVGSSPFSLTADPTTVAACALDGNVDIVLEIVPDPGFADPVTLVASGEPTGASTAFSTNPVTPPGTSTLTVGNLGSATAGDYSLVVDATSGDEENNVSVPFVLNDVAPGAVSLTSPSDGAPGLGTQPTLSWSAPSSSGSTDFLVEVATDAGFGNIVFSETVSGSTSVQVGTPLNTNTEHYWRVTASNACGTADTSETFSFVTASAPGDCSTGSTAVSYFFDDMESGENGWTHESLVGDDTWALEDSDANSPTFSWRGLDIATISDQLLVSPEVDVPAGVNAPTLQYHGKRDMEDGGSGCFDGGLLEYSTDGGTSWTQVDASMLQTNPYTGTVDDRYGNPLATRDAWCGSQDWTRTVVDLTGLDGQSLTFRFRLGTDSSVAADDWHIDDVRVQSCEILEEVIFADGFETPVPKS